MGPPAFAAGMSEPSLSVVTEVEWAGPLRPLGEVEIAKNKNGYCTNTVGVQVTGGETKQKRLLH